MCSAALVPIQVTSREPLGKCSVRCCISVLDGQKIPPRFWNLDRAAALGHDPRRNGYPRGMEEVSPLHLLGRRRSSELPGGWIPGPFGKDITWRSVPQWTFTAEFPYKVATIKNVDVLTGGITWGLVTRYRTDTVTCACPSCSATVHADRPGSSRIVAAVFRETCGITRANPHFPTPP